jgi:hypothetical protein
MLFSSSSHRKYFFVAIAFVSITIILLSGAIIFLINNESKNSGKETKLNTQIQEIITELDKLTTAKDKNDSEYPSAIRNFEKAITTTNKDAKYEQFYFATARVQALYTDTNNPGLYDFINKDLNNFAKKNFPDKYKEGGFIYPCQDPICAKDPQPEEIKEIIFEIENGKFSENTKYIIPINLNSASFLDGKLEKFQMYANTLALLRDPHGIDDIEKSNELADNLEAYLESNFKEEYERYNGLNKAINEAMKNKK